MPTEVRRYAALSRVFCSSTMLNSSEQNSPAAISWATLCVSDFTDAVERQVFPVPSFRAHSSVGHFSVAENASFFAGMFGSDGALYFF